MCLSRTILINTLSPIEKPLAAVPTKQAEHTLPAQHETAESLIKGVYCEESQASIDEKTQRRPRVRLIQSYKTSVYGISTGVYFCLLCK